MSEKDVTGCPSNTFVIKVLNIQNDSWQGSITWADKNKTQHFRSALELIHLIDDAVKSNKM